MCTLTFVPRDSGYYLAMNRDELMSRGTAEPPARADLADLIAIYPRDRAGGTWIAANDRGIAFALLNWNDVPQLGATKVRSRGLVIPYLVRFSCHRDVQTALGGFDLQGILPFRLIGIFPAEKQVSEWRWNWHSLEIHYHAWESRHWFSSSLSDERASTLRGAACQIAWDEEDAGSLQWLRKLHASHAGGLGPFSLCMHREGVKTLSYTEISCTSARVQCSYFPDSPCAMPTTIRSFEMDRMAGRVAGAESPGVIRKS